MRLGRAGLLKIKDKLKTYVVIGDKVITKPFVKPFFSHDALKSIIIFSKKEKALKMRKFLQAVCDRIPLGFDG